VQCPNTNLTKLESAKAKGREPKTGFGQFFNFKLGCFDVVHVLIYADACPHQSLKTRLRFSYVSLSLSMTKWNREGTLTEGEDSVQ
jgi:hypothetical protein